jgi:AcrR family transcriptional regulator
MVVFERPIRQQGSASQVKRKATPKRMKLDKGKKEEKQGSRHQRRVKATRKKILNAAREVFVEKGLDLTTIDNITERADVGKGTFYYHFTEKDELIRNLMDEIMKDLVRAIEQKCAGVTDLPTLLDTMVGAHIDFFKNRWEDFVVYFQGRADLQLQQGYSGLEKPFLTYLERLESLIASVVNYRLPKPMLQRFGYAVAGFVSGYYSVAVISLDGEELDESFHGMRDAFVASLTRFIQEAMSAGQSARSRKAKKAKQPPRPSKKKNN